MTAKPKSKSDSSHFSSFDRLCQVLKTATALIGVIFLAAACSTYAADRYAISVDSQTKLKQIAATAPGRNVNVGEFTASTPGRKAIDCRAVGPIVTPDDETYEAFIRNALVDQLKLAEMYSADASRLITGHVDEINFTSMNGIWNIGVTITDETGRNFTVAETFDYDSSFYGETACNQTAQAFMPAVQDLIQKIVSHPVFAEMVADGA